MYIIYYIYVYVYAYIYIIYIYIDIYVFITEAFFEVALESWPEWDLNPRPYIYHICMHIYIYGNTYIYRLQYS